MGKKKAEIMIAFFGGAKSQHKVKAVFQMKHYVIHEHRLSGMPLAHHHARGIHRHVCGVPR